MKLYYTILGNSLGAVEKFLGTQAFREKYVEKETKFARQEITAELEVWVCQVDFAAASVKLVCCTEDKIRQKRCRPESFIIYIFCFPASGTGIRQPASGIRQPAPAPASGIRSWHRHPVSASGTGIDAATGTPAPGTRQLASASTTGHRHPAYGTRHPASATDTGHLAPAIP